MNYKLLLVISAVLSISTAQATQECLGRLSFDQPKAFEWALATSLLPMDSHAGFFNNNSLLPDEHNVGIYPSENRWDYSTNLNIITSPLTDGEAFQRQWRSYKTSGADLMRQKKEVRGLQGILEDLINGQKEQKEKLKQGEKISKAKLISDKNIEDYKKYLLEAQNTLDEMENRVIPVVKLEGIGDEAYTINYDVQRAFVRSGGRDYMFYLSNRGNGRWGFTEADTTVDELKALLAHFSPRQLGEVPKQTGFCFPYGFMQDDGSVDHEIKNSFRFNDAPNVIYSLYTGNNHRISQGEVATYGAFTNVNYDPVNYNKQDIKQTVTLKNGATLKLKGWSITEKIPQDPKKPLYLYHAWGEINGLLPNNKPFIVVQITSYRPNAEGNRPQSPMPFEQALKRLIPILNSIKPLN